ncbi:hypothetical protein [Patiriisocius sp. Uisw_047]|uniref:hypothetical protein n=1 Tax=Patiriisocius sp. Uisw_047 TaxID=3230969 RepID=UPI0039E9FE55
MLAILIGRSLETTFKLIKLLSEIREKRNVTTNRMKIQVDVLLFVNSLSLKTYINNKKGMIKRNEKWKRKVLKRPKIHIFLLYAIKLITEQKQIIAAVLKRAPLMFTTELREMNMMQRINMEMPFSSPLTLKNNLNDL